MISYKGYVVIAKKANSGNMKFRKQALLLLTGWVNTYSKLAVMTLDHSGQPFHKIIHYHRYY